MKLKKLLVIMAIVIGALMIANVSNAAMVDNDYFSVSTNGFKHDVIDDYDDDTFHTIYLAGQDDIYDIWTAITVFKKDYHGGTGYTQEDLQEDIDFYTENSDATIVEAELMKISGAYAKRLLIRYDYEEYGYSSYVDRYDIQTDNREVEISTYTDYYYMLKSNKYASMISSLKIKDTIAKQNDGVPFNDVSNKQWYHAPIKYVYEKGYISGLNAYTYGPNVNLSRCMLVTILWRISGNPAAKGNVSFPDIKESDWYYTPVIWAAENGIVNGYGNGKFGPNDNVSREQLAAMLRNYATFRGKDNSYSLSSLEGFKDKNKIADWASPSVAWAVKNSIIGGKNSGTIVDPQGNATRAEVATMIMNFCENILK